MKIFLISNMYPSKTDPLFGVFVKNFKDHLEDANVTFSAISVIKGKRSTKFQKLFAYFKYYISVTFNYIFKKYDVVYVHFMTHNAPILLLLFTCFGKRKPLVVNVHGDDVISSKGKKIDKINRLVLKKTDLIVAPSSYFKEMVLTNYPFLAESQVFVSPSAGVNMQRFYPIYRSENKVPILGMISRIDRGKGWDVFLKALKILKDSNIAYKAIIAGQGLEETAMHAMISDLNLTNEVKFLGLVNQNELVHLYNKMDLMVFPTTREAESLGLVGLEAMSCKTPVVGSNIAGLKTYINHKENGFLFTPGNASELVENIKQFLQRSISKREGIRTAAYHTAQGYESKIVLKELHQRLEELCIKN